MTCGAASFMDMEYYCFTPPNSKRSTEIGTPCNNVPPREDGTFDLELGVALPDLLPALDGKYEYALDVAADKEPTQRLAVSNLMARLRYQLNGDHLQALAHRSVLARIRKGEFELIPKDSTEEMLRTFVTSQFRIAGATAADALDDHLSDTFDVFLVYLNQLLRFISLVDEAPGTVYSTAYTRSTFDSLYFVVIGGSTEQAHIGHGRVMPHAGRTNLNPPVWPSELSALVRNYLNGTSQPTDTDALLHAAKRYFEAGALDFCVLLSVVAAEVATRRFAVGRYLALGVSKNKLDAYESDYKFSMLLNVEMFVLTPPELKPDRNLVGKVNRARDMRNDYMHEGKAIKDKETAFGVLQDAVSFIKFIDDVRTHLASGRSPASEPLKN